MKDYSELNGFEEFDNYVFKPVEKEEDKKDERDE